MSQHIAIVVGSISSNSLNRRLAEGLIKLAPSDVKFTFVDLKDLPHYNHDDDGKPFAPAVQTFRDAISAADGVMFVTPEYNRSMPGVLKNALDIGSRPYGQSIWNRKPAGVIGATPGAIGTALGQHHLRSVLAYLNMPTMGQPEAYVQTKPDTFNADGSIGEGSREFLQGWMDAFLSWVAQQSR